MCRSQWMMLLASLLLAMPTRGWGDVAEPTEEQTEGVAQPLWQESRPRRERLHPQNPRARAKWSAWQRGQEAIRAGMTHDAVEAFQEALRFDPNDPDLYNNLGVCFAQLSRDNEAMAMFRQAITLDAGHEQARVNLAWILHTHNQVPEAIELLSPLTAHSQNPMVWQRLGFLYAVVGDRTGAIDVYQRALQLVPEHVAIVYDLGCLYALNNQLDEAMKMMRRAIALEEHLAIAHDALGQLYELQGSLAMAKESYRMAHQLDPAQPKFLRHLARVLIHNLEFTDARQVVEQLLLLDARRTDAQYYEALIFLQDGSYDRAALAFERIVEQSPKDATAWNNLAVAYNRMGELARAEGALAKAKALAPGSAAVQTNLGVVAAKTQQWSQAQKAWTTALELEPDFEAAVQNLDVLKAITPARPSDDEEI